MRRRNEVLVGVLTTVAIIMLIIGGLWLARGGLSSGYPLYVKVPWGAGLKQGQPVLLSGVNIGIVDAIEFKREGGVVAKLAIQKQYEVPKGTTATVEANGLFGDMLIALRPTIVTAQNFQPGDTIPSGRPAPTIADITAKADSVASSANDIARSVQVQLSGPNGSVQDLQTLLRSMNRLTAQIATIAAQQSAELTRTQLALRRAMSGLDSATIDSTLRNVRATAANASRLTADLDTTTAKMNRLLTALDSGQGTAGKLLRDTLLYADLRRLVGHLDSLTVDFSKNPKKYINLSIF